jgi:hypothetical protein
MCLPRPRLASFQYDLLATLPRAICVKKGNFALEQSSPGSTQMPSSDHLRRCLQGFKKPSQSFGTIYSDAIDSSDPNSHLGGDPLPADALGAQRGNPLRVQDLLRAPEALTLGACRLEACLHPLEIGKALQESPRQPWHR